MAFFRLKNWKPRKTYNYNFGKKSVAKKVKTLTRRIKNLPKAEVKEYQNRITGNAFTYAGDIGTPLTGIAQGYTGDGTRVGDELTLRNMRLKILITNPSGTNAPTLNRVIVFQLKNNPDSIVTVGSTINLILDSTGVGTVTAPMSPFDINNRNAYRVLYDKTFVINQMSGPGTSASNSAQIKYLNCNIKFPQGAKKVEYSVGTGNITRNETYIMVISNTSSSQTWAFDATTYYYDN